MRVSSCKNCGTSIIWLPKNDGSTRWNPPLNAESAQSGYCIVNGRVEFTYMYRKHSCTTEAIEAYALAREMQETRPAAPRELGFRHLDGMPGDAAIVELEREQRLAEERIAEKQRKADQDRAARADAAAEAAAQAPEMGFTQSVPDQQYHKHFGNVPADVIEKAKQTPNMSWSDMRELRRLDALRRDCPTCGQPEGEPCKSMQAYHIKRGVVSFNKDPHKHRVSDNWYESETSSHGL